MSASWAWVVPLLACPQCRGPIRILELDGNGSDGILGHDDTDCNEVFPVIDAIPRMVLGAERARVRARHAAWFEIPKRSVIFEGWSVAAEMSRASSVVARFDDEWRAFADVGSAEHSRLFDDYFDLVPPDSIGPDRVVLDAGCGAGRWAVQVQHRGARVIAVDLGFSIEVASRNTQASARVACVQADVCRLPVADGSVDLAYSLGVLHHIERTEVGLREVARTVRPGGQCLVYLYRALEVDPWPHRVAFRAVDAVRKITSTLPQDVLVPLTTLIAAVVYLPLARISLVLRTIGLARVAAALPLSFYADLSFRTMRNDSLDRFGTRIEKRFRASEVRDMLERVGLVDVSVSKRAPFWHAVAERPLRPDGVHAL